MNYQKGDILLKIDLRAIIPQGRAFNTRHHAMLIIDTDQKSGSPIIAHMTFFPPGLKIERLQHGKDLYLLRYPFSPKVRDKITTLAKLAHESKKFSISDVLLKNQYEASNLYRFPSKNKKEAESHFERQVFNPVPLETIEISCHEFVLAVVQAALIANAKPLPQSLQMAPPMAWSDVWLDKARQDREAQITEIPRINPAYNCQSLFTPPATKEQPELLKEAGCRIL